MEKGERKLPPIRGRSTPERTRLRPPIKPGEYSEDEIRVMGPDPELLETYKRSVGNVIEGEKTFQEWWNEQFAEQKEVTSDEFLDAVIKTDKYTELLKLEEGEVPFEERDILKERISPDQRAKLEKKKKEQELLEYNPEEFKLMQKAFYYNILAKGIPALERGRPRGADGRPFNDEEIRELAKDYQKTKKIKDWYNYSSQEIKLMKEAASWRYMKQKTRGLEEPAYADGTPMTRENINELTKDYKELRKKRPFEFALLKTEIGDWQRVPLFLKKEKFKGRDQIVSYHKQKIGDLVYTVKYILENLPKDFELKLKGSAEHFFIVRHAFPVKGKNFIVAFIELRPPFDVKKARERAIEKQKAKAVEVTEFAREKAPQKVEKKKAEKVEAQEAETS